MKSYRSLHQVMTALLALGLIAVAPAAKAELISTQQLTQASVAAPNSQAQGRQTIDAFLQRVDVQRKLQAMGLSQTVSAQRVAALSNAEVQELSGQINAQPAAGDLSNNDLIIILLVAILVVVAT